MQGLATVRKLLLVAGICLLPPAAALAADDPPAAAAPSEPPAPEPAGKASGGQSPWEHPLWHDASTLMRLYVCEHARRPPGWCDDDDQRKPAPAALPEVQGPPLRPEDAAWTAFLRSADPARFTPDEVAMIRRRAVERRDPQAMEILGFLHAEGLSVERDYVEAYRWYGMAFLAGERDVRANMDIVWQQLQRHNIEGALALAREFDALAKGDVPPGLGPPPESASPEPALPESASPEPALPESAPPEPAPPEPAPPEPSTAADGAAPSG